MNFIVATPKPRPALEIHLGRLPRWFAFALVTLTMGILIYTVFLYAQMETIPKLDAAPSVSVAEVTK